MNDQNALVIDTQNLTKTYKGVNALQSLNLKVPRNSIFGFLGPNGAGKTTTIKLLLGLARPTSGTACIFGMDVVNDSTEIRKRVGYLAQDPRFYENMTARETLRFTARFFYNGPKAAIEDRINNTLELVGLADKADRSIKGFSGGERQRLGIAQAQINYPDLLILDEPAAALDPMGRHDVLEVMERLRKHTTVFYSTHILDDVQKVSDSVAILKQGQLVAQAPIEDLLAGNEGIVYTISVKGDSNGTQSRLASLPWVSTVITTPSSNGSIQWQVSVSNETAAENQLLRLLLEDRQLTVTEFGRKKHDLEEVFMSIVGEEQYVR
ncbi:MAG: ABC transporter ATP-binding protein [Anaerolineae bacterium]|nr:ABC transporter ATP-binding protein [Anaerolineae bacterium]